jgi:mRNA interferase MazF
MQKNSSYFSLGDIIVIELPFSDLEGSKLRPVLVVSSNKLNKNRPDIVVCKITGSHFKTDYEISLTNDDLIEGKLKKNIWIDVAVIQSIEKKLIKQKIAKINETKIKYVKNLLKDVFDF